MANLRLAAVVASAAVVLLASLVAAPTIRPGVPSEGPSRPSGPSLVTDISPVPFGSELRPLTPDYPLTLAFTLVPSHPQEFAALLSEINDPGAPEYHHFLTYAEYLDRFAPSPGAADRVRSALQAAGATTITVAPDRSSLLATLTVREAEATFGVQFVTYGHDGALPLYSATGSLVLPGAFQGRVSAIDGLSNAGGATLVPTLGLAGPVRAMPVAARTSGDSGPGRFLYDNATASQWFVGSDFTQAYGATALFPSGGVANATYPSGVAVATLLASGYNVTNAADLPPWDPAVLRAYFNDTLPSYWPKPQIYGVPVTIGSVTPPAPGSLGAMNDSTLDEWENSLDLEMAGSLAPGSSVYNFYFAGSLLASSSATAQSIASDFAQSLADVLGYNYTPAHLGVVSASFGLPDLNNSAWNRELDVAALLGVPIVVASGDQANAPDSRTGGSDGPWPTWPASATFNDSGAIAVGGVSLSLTGTPGSYLENTSVNLTFDANDGTIRSMVAWYDTLGGPRSLIGTEGGVSTVFAEPFWQFDSAAQWPIVNATETQGASALGRAEPDVAFAANTTIAAVFANATGTIFVAPLAGTSIAAPLFAGLLADEIGVLSARNTSGWAPLGFLDPELYRIASYYEAHPGPATDPFLDVTEGANYVFRAASGWDAVTGWGGLMAAPFLSALSDPAVNGYVYSGPTPSLPPAHSGGTSIPWTIIFVIFGVGIAVAVALVVLMARPTRPTGPVTIPYGAQAGGTGAPFGPGTQGGVYPGATFLCPYCGAVRPAEPVRCPQCGTL